MGSSESKTQEILSKKIQSMSGPEVLEAAGGIRPEVTILPDSVAFTFGDFVSGKVLMKINKPIFFVEDGLIQITLEGKEVFQLEDGGAQVNKQTG